MDLYPVPGGRQQYADCITGWIREIQYRGWQFPHRRPDIPRQREDIEKLGITLYENYYIEATLDNESTMRFFKNREEINKVCLMKGELPKAAGEIAIDRMYADNNQLTVGDTITSGEHSWKITGLVALSDYSCLFQNNSDSMIRCSKIRSGCGDTGGI